MFSVSTIVGMKNILCMIKIQILQYDTCNYTDTSILFGCVFIILGNYSLKQLYSHT